jgi:hypothetical protein
MNFVQLNIHFHNSFELLHHFYDPFQQLNTFEKLNFTEKYLTSKYQRYIGNNECFSGG